MCDMNFRSRRWLYIGRCVGFHTIMHIVALDPITHLIYPPSGLDSHSSVGTCEDNITCRYAHLFSNGDFRDNLISDILCECVKCIVLFRIYVVSTDQLRWDILNFLWFYLHLWAEVTTGTLHLCNLWIPPPPFFVYHFALWNLLSFSISKLLTSCYGWD